MKNTVWITKVAYLSDIFNIINTLNLSLQRPPITVFTMYNKVYALKKKIQLWIWQIQEGTLRCLNLFYHF